MEDNSKLFVFNKVEVVLIFVFIVIIAITSFTLGVRTGKQLSLKEDNYTKEDVKNIDLKSVDEEYVDKVIQDKNSPSSFEKDLENKEVGNGDVDSRLREEMEKLARSDANKNMEPENKAESETPMPSENAGTEIKSEDDLYKASNPVKGKFTIQLYANQSKTSAEEFADGFLAKGYDVIINEVTIPGKGTWYRVSIGVFDTLDEAREYLEKETSLFQNKDYIIQQF